MIYNSTLSASEFTFTIYVSNPSGTHVELVGAFMNAFGAIKAYEMLLICHNPPDVITLRNGARVMREETAVGGFREWMMSRSTGSLGTIERMRNSPEKQTPSS